MGQKRLQNELRIVEGCVYSLRRKVFGVPGVRACFVVVKKRIREIVLNRFSIVHPHVPWSTLWGQAIRQYV